MPASSTPPVFVETPRPGENPAAVTNDYLRYAVDKVRPA